MSVASLSAKGWIFMISTNFVSDKLFVKKYPSASHIYLLNRMSSLRRSVLHVIRYHIYYHISFFFINNYFLKNLRFFFFKENLNMHTFFVNVLIFKWL